MKQILLLLLLAPMFLFAEHEVSCSTSIHKIQVNFGYDSTEVITSIVISDTSEDIITVRSKNLDVATFDYTDASMYVVYSGKPMFKIIVNDSVSLFEFNETPYPLSCYW